jgi:uncharacterized OsmC-like protein
MSIDSVRAIGSNTPYAVALSDDLGHTWTGDEPESLGGGNTGPSPSRLILSGLASCTVVTVQMYAARKQWPLSRYRSRGAVEPERQTGRRRHRDATPGHLARRFVGRTTRATPADRQRLPHAQSTDGHHPRPHRASRLRRHHVRIRESSRHFRQPAPQLLQHRRLARGTGAGATRHAHRDGRPLCHSPLQPGRARPPGARVGRAPSRRRCKLPMPSCLPRRSTTTRFRAC